ncbi:MAG: hypothetical protein KDC87_10885, partial [Planctomycetes bacterium]|nr:hypothetical protein [Planctomycetota bacterium]
MTDLPPSRRRLLRFAWAGLTFFYLLRLVAVGVAAPPNLPCVRPVTVELNRASIAQLCTLPGIGRTKAQAI